MLVVGACGSFLLGGSWVGGLVRWLVGGLVVISTSGAFRNVLPRTYVNALNHAAALRRAPRGRPDLAGCLPRCVRTGGRVEVCEKKWFRHWTNRTLSCSGCSKQEQHSHTPDVRRPAVAPTSIGWPSWPQPRRIPSIYNHQPRTKAQGFGNGGKSTHAKRRTPNQERFF